MRLRYALFTILFACLVIHINCAESEATIINYSQDLTDPAYYSILEVYDSPPDTTTINILGARILTLDIFDSSIINVHEGSAMAVRAFNSSTFNFYNGDNIAIVALDSSTVNLFGGQIGSINALLDSEINVFGYDFEYIASENTDPRSIGNGGTLNGYWQNGNSFSILLHDTDNISYDHLNLIIVPEPCTVLLLGFGGLVLRKWRRR